MFIPIPPLAVREYTFASLIIDVGASAIFSDPYLILQSWGFCWVSWFYDRPLTRNGSHLDTFRLFTSFDLTERTFRLYRAPNASPSATRNLFMRCRCRDTPSRSTQQWADSLLPCSLLAQPVHRFTSKATTVHLSRRSSPYKARTPFSKMGRVASYTTPCTQPTQLFPSTPLLAFWPR